MNRQRKRIEIRGLKIVGIFAVLIFGAILIENSRGGRMGMFSRDR